MALNVSLDRIIPITEARARLREQGFPTRREEAWKYTNPQRITGLSCQPASAAGVDPAAVKNLALVPADGPLAIFVNGRLDRELSSLNRLPKGLVCQRVGDAGSHDAALRSALDAAPNLEDRSFASLADAFFEEGLLLRAEPGVEVGTPVTVVHLSVGHDPSAAAASHPRLWVRAEAGSRLSVREIFLALDEGQHLTNTYSQYHAEAGASLRRTAIQVESAASTYLATVVMRADRDAHLTHRTFSIGAGLTREDLVCDLAGSGAECDLRGLYVTREGQHSDHHTTVEHRVPHCSSRQLYRGILGGHSRGAFTGKVVVWRGAQKSDAHQKNESLLLSKRAEADSKPQLEIYADDVKCSHGSTIGQLDADQIFYLRSRGIDTERARGILIRGFAGAISAEIEAPALREAVETRISEHLQGGGAQ